MSVREGYKQTEIGVIPEEWEVVELRDIATLGKEKFTPLDNKTLKYIGLEHIDQHTGRLLSVGNSNETMSTKNIFAEGDILFGKLRPYLRKYHLASFDGVCSTEILPLRANTKTDRGFLFNIIQTDSFIEHSTSKMFGTKMPRTNWNILKIYKLPLPPLPEQQKIAAILTSVDNKIEVIDEQIAKTEELKKGLMQKLLSEGIGHMRAVKSDDNCLSSVGSEPEAMCHGTADGFKESEIGRIPKEWEVVRLETISDFITKGATPTTYGFDWEETGIPFLRSECVSDSGLDLKAAMFISNEAHSHMERSQIVGGDLLMTITGNVGRVVMLEPSFGIGNINQHIARIRIVNPNVVKTFVYHYLSQDKYRLHYYKITTGQAYPQISLKQVRNSLIPVPSLSEQKQIATILSTTDNKLDTLREKKSRYEKLKKGLMQKLLTGEVRVKV